MTLQHFNTLSQHIQHRNLLLNGVCLADRHTEDACALLFQLHNFYVEIFFTREGDEILHSRCFEDTEELTPYLDTVDVSGVI